MGESEVILLKTAAMFLVIAAGWIARRRGLIAETHLSFLGKLVVDFTFPALVFTQLISTIHASDLRVGWFYPFVGAAVLLISLAAGWVIAEIVRPGSRRRTVKFLVFVPNWIYLPLPIVQATSGSEGVVVLLLYNVGAMTLLWSLGVRILQGPGIGWSGLKNVARNPGLLATFAGVLVALAIPSSHGWGTLDRGSVTEVVLGASTQALAMVGSLTVPMSLIMTGAQLGGLPLRMAPDRNLVGVILGRLVLAPVFVLIIGGVLNIIGLPLPAVAAQVTFLIAVMPVGVSSSVFAERFGGDTGLTSQAIFLTTLISLATIPMWAALVW